MAAEAEAAAPAARKRPAPDEAGAAEAGRKRAALCKLADMARDDDAVVKPVRGEGDDDNAPDLSKDVAATDGTVVDQVIGVQLAGLTCSLRSRLTPPPQRFSEDETRHAMRQLLRAAEKLHATGAVHFNLNPDSILVSPGAGALKIHGFGPAASEKKLDGTLSLQYRSPEQLIRARRYGSEVDVWALGCVMAELLTGEPLFAAGTEEDVLEQVIDLRDDIVMMEVEAFDDTIPDLSLAGREVLVGLLSFDSDERLTAADALKHRWFTITEEEDVAA